MYTLIAWGMVACSVVLIK